MCGNKVVEVPMPARCREVTDAAQVQRKIKLYVADRKQIWLSIDDVEWAVRYLYTQNLLKGVPLVSDDSPGPGGPGCSFIWLLNILCLPRWW